MHVHGKSLIDFGSNITAKFATYDDHLVFDFYDKYDIDHLIFARLSYDSRVLILAWKHDHMFMKNILHVAYDNHMYTGTCHMVLDTYI